MLLRQYFLFFMSVAAPQQAVASIIMHVSRGRSCAAGIFTDSDALEACMMKERCACGFAPHCALLDT
jgi:hypothetical protein